MTATLALATACQPPRATELGPPVPRGLETRVVESTVYHECAELGSPRGDLRPVDCGRRLSPAESRELLPLSEPGRDATLRDRAIAAAAAVALSAAPRTLERSAGALSSAAGAETAEPAALIALGALQHAQARATGDPAFLVDALESTSRALRLQPESHAALFNRALIEADLALCRQAEKSWREYLAADRSSKWADEGRIRATLLPCGEAEEAAQAPASEASIFDPDAAFELALESLLPRWSEVRAESPEKAKELVAQLAELGDRLAMVSRDRTVLELARELAVSLDSSYAHAVHSYTSGYQRFRAKDYLAAEQLLMMARASLAEHQSVLRPWCDIWLAGIEIYSGRLQDAYRRLDLAAGVRESADSPLLEGRILWTRGLADLRAGRLERAYDGFLRAETELDRGGYGTAVAAIRTLKAEALDDLGFLRGSWRDRIRALRALQQPRPPFPYRNGLITGAKAAAALGATEAAERMIQEALVLASQQEDPHVAAEVLMRRADILLDRGELAEAADTFALALEQSLALPEPALRGRLVANARLGLASSRPMVSETDASFILEIADYYAANGPTWRRLDALRIYSRAAHGDGTSKAALAALDEAIDVIRGVRAEIRQENLGSQYWEAAQEIFDQAIREAIRSEKAIGALALLEEARGLQGASEDLILPPFCHRQSSALPSIEQAGTSSVILAFGVLGDDLAWWRLDGGRCRFGWAREGAARREVETFLAQQATGDVAPDVLESLYRALLLEPLLGVEPGRELIVVPDRHLLQLPFAALRNPETRRFLVEERAVSLQPSLSQALRSGSRVSSTEARDRWRAVVVGDPAYSRRALPWLPRLPGAEIEARRIAALYGDEAVLLTGTDPTARRLQEELPGSQVLHLGTHATAGPEGGFDLLVLAAEPRERASGLTPVPELFKAGPEPDLELVVLSACSTLEGKPSRSGGLIGIGRHFTTRGIPAVVGTLWPVSDALMTNLMIAFHQGVLQGLPASEALRRAQLRSLDRDRVRSCCDWAAVELVGNLPGTSPPTERSHR